MRIVVAITAALVSTLGISLAQDATATIRKSTNIPAQRLGPALQALAEQRDLQVVYLSDIVDSETTAGAQGDFTVDEALRHLLQGTQLTYRYLDDNTITIIAAPAASGQTTGQVIESAVHTHLAQVGQASTAAAASSEGPATELRDQTVEEVIVTAQKREQRLIEVPMSVSALGEAELAERGIDSMLELSMAVPGLAMADNGPGARRITMRGVGNIFGGSSLVGLYLDEAAVTGFPDAAIDLRVYDLERVEVLRGPQGTLYGEGASGGTIRFITKDQELDAFRARGDLTASFTKDGSPSQEGSAMINVPVVQDTLGLRVAGTFANTGGWIDQPAQGRSDINDQELRNVRVKGLWQPNEAFRASLMVIAHRNDAGAQNSGADRARNYQQPFLDPSSPTSQDDYDLYNATLSYDFPAVRLLSTSSYLEIDKVRRNFGFLLPQFPPPAAPFEMLADPFQWEGEVFTQELRLTSSGESRWNWTAGALYRDAQLLKINSFIIGQSGGPVFPVTNLTDNTSKSWAAFGDASYALTDRLELGAGVRYFEDDREVFDGATRQAATFNSTNPRVYASYALSRNARIYASAAKGFRSGGFNSLGQPPYDPESLWSYEVGTKAMLGDGRLNVELALFRSNYDDIQVIGVTAQNPVNITSNLGEATIEGVDFSMSLALGRDWLVGATGNFVDTQIDSLRATSSSHAVGDPLDLVPKHSFTVWTSYGFDWSSAYSGRIRLDYSQQGRSTYRNRSIGEHYISRSDVIDMLNARIELQKDAWSIALFVENAARAGLGREILDAERIDVAAFVERRLACGSAQSSNDGQCCPREPLWGGSACCHCVCCIAAGACGCVAVARSACGYACNSWRDLDRRNRPSTSAGLARAD